MSKKVNKKTEEVKNVTLSNEEKSSNDAVHSVELTNDLCDIKKLQNCDSANTVKLSNISIIELIALEKACALLCKRFETIARLDSTNNAKFKEYQMYYEKIFSELESRVNIICNAV